MRFAGIPGREFCGKNVAQENNCHRTRMNTGDLQSTRKLAGKVTGIFHSFSVLTTDPRPEQ